MKILVTAGLVLGTLAACEQSSARARLPEAQLLTPDEQARRDSFREEWLRQQDSTSRADSAVASVYRLPPVVMTSPLVIGFTPPPHWNGAVGQLEHDTASLRFQEDAAVLRKLAEQAGYTYIGRYGPRISIQDPWHNSGRSISVGMDSVGVVVVAPGFPALTRYGPVEPAVLRRVLESYAERLGRRPAPAPAI
jgi:hypothetical protein